MDEERGMRVRIDEEERAILYTKRRVVEGDGEQSTAEGGQ
jgi:hypothetical protein